MEKIKNSIKNNKIELIIAFASTFIWGIFAHAYIFLNNSISHDSLNEFVYINDWKIRIGRVLAPILKGILGTKVAYVWAIGIISLIFLSLAVFLLIKIFNIKSKIVSILISGIITVNLTIIALSASCIHDLDVNSLSILSAIFAVYCLKKSKKGYLLGSLFCTLTLGIYQCNISIVITLIIMCSIIDLIHGSDFKEVIFNGFKGIVMIIFGGIIYIALLKIIPLCMNIPLADHTYNSVVIREISLKGILGAYSSCLSSIVTAVSIYPIQFTVIINTILFIFMIIVYANIIKNAKYDIKTKILTTILFVIIPFGMNISYILDGGYAHDMMKYAYWLIYVFILILVSDNLSLEDIKEKSKKIIKVCPCVLVFVIAWGNTQLANETYLKKEIESKATLAYMNRVLERIESFEGYQEGITEVAFVVKIPSSLNKRIPGFESSYKITGNGSSYAINGRGDRIYYEAYFNYIALNPIKLAQQEKWDKMQTLEEVKEMKSYPDKECMKMIDNVLVVKLGE